MAKAPSMLAAVPQLCLDALDDAAWAARSQPPSPLSPASTLGLPASFGRTYLAARAFDPPRGGRRVAREGSWWQVQEVESGGSVRIFQTGAQGTEFCLMAHPSGVVVVSEADADVGRSSLWKAEQVEGRAGALRLQCSSGAQGAGAGGEGAYLVASTSRRLTVARLPPGSWPASSEWQLEAADEGGDENARAPEALAGGGAVALPSGPFRLKSLAGGDRVYLVAWLGPRMPSNSPRRSSSVGSSRLGSPFISPRTGADFRTLPSPRRPRSRSLIAIQEQ